MGPKKPKLTKKQIEEMKALQEQERLAQEALEKKLAEEEAERQRIAEEKRRAEEEKRQREEKVRLDEQAPKYEERVVRMFEVRQAAEKARIKDLPDKYLACDPLPDPEDEKDLTTFIRLWLENSDKTLKDSVMSCQTAENVIKSVNGVLAEALSQDDKIKVDWCHKYIDELRAITLKKFDDVSVAILRYFEEYSTYTDEELAEMAAQNKHGAKGGQDNRIKDLVTLCEESPDLCFGIWANVLAKNMNYKWINYNNRWQSMCPNKSSGIKLIMRCLWTAYDAVSGRENQKKASTIVVGGVCYNAQYQMPESAKPASKWTMRPIKTNDDTLILVPYPLPGSQPEPVQVFFFLPKSVYIHPDDKHTVGVWDDEKHEWSTEYVSDLEYHEAECKLGFSLTKFAPVAYLQAKTTDYPYDSWYLRSTGDARALLTIKTKRVTLNIEIQPLYVRLIEAKEPQLAELNDQLMHPGMLLMELSRRGIHLMPTDEDAERGGIHLKDKVAEERAICDIAQTLKAFAFQSLKWSQAADAGNIICRMRENPDNFREFFEDDESDWKSVQWWSNKVSFIKARNCDSSFNAEIMDGQATQAMLALAVPGVYSDNAAERSNYVDDIEFIDTVIRTLRMTRLLAFSTAAYDKRTLEEQQQ